MDMVTGFRVACRAVPYAIDALALRITRARGAERGGAGESQSEHTAGTTWVRQLAAPMYQMLSDPKRAGGRWDSDQYRPTVLLYVRSWSARCWAARVVGRYIL